MGLKEEYQEKIQAQLEDWSQKLQELKARAQASATGARTEFDKQMETLREKLATAQNRLKELRDAGVETWEQIRPGLEQSMEDLQRAMEGLGAMRQTYQEKGAAQIQEWSDKIEAYRVKGEAALAEAKKDLDRRLEGLRGKLVVAPLKLQELRQASSETWESVRGNLDQALGEVKEAWDSTVGMRQAYQEKLEAQLKEWSAKIEDLKGRAGKASGEARVELNKQIEKLRGMQETAQARLKDAREAGGEAWEKVRSGLDKTVGDLKSTWDKVAAKFRKGGPQE